MAMCNSSAASAGDYAEESIQIKIDPTTELEVCRFYIKILNEMCKLSNPSFQDIRSALSNIRSCKNLKLDIRGIVSFDRNIDRLAYIFAYGFIHSSVIYNHFSNLLKSNPTMKEKIISMRELRLCILGGGPGFESVAICSVISNLRNQNGEKSRQLSLNITIIDTCNGWKNDVDLIIRQVQEDEMCSSRNIKIDFKFITADCTSFFSTEVKEALKNAHIITMFKFLSHIGASILSVTEIHQMVKKIMNYMKPKACLFLLDVSGGDYFKTTDRVIDEHLNMSRIYKASHYCHVINTDSIEYISQSLKNPFLKLKCTEQTKMSCSAWLKTDGIIETDELSLRISALSIRKSVKDSDANKKVKSKKRNAEK